MGVSSRRGAQVAELQQTKAAAHERVLAAESDRREIFADTQKIEQRVLAEKKRKVEAQASAEHYRNLLHSVVS